MSPTRRQAQSAKNTSNSVDDPNSNHHRNSDQDGDNNDFVLMFQSLKKYAILGFLVGALIAITPVVFLRLGLPSTLTAERAIDFTFPGAEERKYPNGRLFSFNDVLAPSIVNKTYTEMGFEELGVDLAQFRNGLTIEPFAPTYKERATSFRSKFKLDEITATEVELIEEQMRNALSELTKTSALIRVSFKGDLGVSKEKAEQSISKLLANWAAYSINELGVNQLPLAVSHAELISEDVEARTDFPMFVELLDDAGKALAAHLKNISDVNDTQTMTSAEGAETLLDVTRDYNILKKYRIEPFKKSVIAYGLADDWPNTQIYATQTKRELELALQVLKGKAADLNSAANFYKKLNSGDVVGGVNTSGDRVVEDFVISGTQSGSDAFANRVFDIARTNDHQNFLQELVLDQLSVQESIAQLETKIQRLDAFLTSANEFNNPIETDLPLTTREQAFRDAKFEKKAITIDLNLMWRRANEILSKSNDSRINNISGLYNFVGEEKASYYYHPIANKRVVILIIVICFAISILFVMFGFAVHLTRSLNKNTF